MNIKSENEFVDIDSSSDVVAEVAREAKTSAVAIETIDPQPVSRQDEAYLGVQMA
jgi:hypothetical protein